MEVTHQGHDRLPHEAVKLKPYADKLFVVLYFPVRSSRSSAHGRRFANIPWGRELGFYSGG